VEFDKAVDPEPAHKKKAVEVNGQRPASAGSQWAKVDVIGPWSFVIGKM
jgi:hypothetical protein